MTYAERHNELNFVTDKGLHAAFAKMTAEELDRVCVALSGESEYVNETAEAMVEQIASEKR